MTDASDRNLLFGVLALQLDLIDCEQFTKACVEWALETAQPLAKILKDRGWITAEDEHEITRNIDRKLKRHADSAHATLAAAADSGVREVLRSIDQPAIRQSLDGLPPLVGHVLLETIVPDGVRASTLRYTLSKIHGEGGLGRVWLAKHTDLNRRVALKEVRVEKAGDPRYLRRFLKEAQITGQLEHPNIVPVYELA